VEQKHSRVGTARRAAKLLDTQELHLRISLNTEVCLSNKDRPQPDRWLTSKRQASTAVSKADMAGLHSSLQLDMADNSRCHMADLQVREVTAEVSNHPILSGRNQPHPKVLQAVTLDMEHNLTLCDAFEIRLGDFFLPWFGLQKSHKIADVMAHLRVCAFARATRAILGINVG
jgi:hypothetical protein